MEELWASCGWVHTELGDAGARGFSVDDETIAKLMISVDESCDGMMNVLSKTIKAEHGGKLVEWSGKSIQG